MNHRFVISWDQQGLEYIGDITEDEQRRTWAALKGQKLHTALPNLQHLILRARFNPQRHYEIYLIEATDGITASDIQQMFDSNPQAAADTVRKLGTCLFSNREQRDKILIT